MEQQPKNEQVQELTERMQGEHGGERPVARRLRIELLEERVAPNAIWGD
jgi:hypothetical protein